VKVQTIAIIGAGFSGAITAVQLLRHAPPSGVRVVLFNRSGRMARGLAYGTRSGEHLLNVPAGNMSALPEDPEHFLRYCRWLNPEVKPTSFVSRRWYGSYLEAVLSAADDGANEQSTLVREVGEVQRLVSDEARAITRIDLTDGRSIEADRVILAFGHFAPADPGWSQEGVCATSRYVRDPWASGALESIGRSDRVLLLGSGLTAVDVALALHRDERNGMTQCLSRRGLEPLAHREGSALHRKVDETALLAEMGGTVRGQMRALRLHIRSVEEAGGDWRDVLATLRRHMPELWQNCPDAERRRFLRHVQPYWDVHRHRCAPQAWARWRALRESGQVLVRAGRLLTARAVGGEIHLELRGRGRTETQALAVDWVVNCTGPDTRVNFAKSALLSDLLAQGALRADGNGLGIEVNSRYSVIDALGRANQRLHYVGPLLRARDWEATAVPELRQHARNLALQVLGLPSA
jgi:uncharacterized NAD(P)/FAD-binding protein YdhS